MPGSRRGLTIVESLLAIACTGLLLTICSVALAGDGHGARTKERSQKDATQLREIHQSLLIFSREFDEIFPRPGLINRLPDPKSGRDVPGRGPEDITANTTANFYSALIMHNYMGPKLSISPVERNPNVKPDDDYDWERYNPMDDVYWDASFDADLQAEANASYAHLVIFGQRAKEQWCENLNPHFVMLSNRGPLSGEPDGESYTSGPHGHWAGHVVYNDNHTELIDTFTPRRQQLRVRDGLQTKDNIFRMEDGPEGGDAILSFTRSINADGPVLQHD